MHLTIIICTKDRPDDLNNLLSSIGDQNRAPDKVIVVDGSDNPVKHVVDNFNDLNISYYVERPPSLPKQRNRGISQLSGEAEWVCFLDDDIVLEKDTLLSIERFMEGKNNLERIGGIGLVIQNIVNPKTSWLRRMFFLDLKNGGKFTLSGCPSRHRVISVDQQVEWLSGGATIWHIDVLKKFDFDEWFSGTGYYEDIDFSYRVSKEYELWRVAQAKCDHNHHPTRKDRYVGLGEWQLVGWWYFISKYKKFNKLLVLWSMAGVSAQNFFMGVLRPQTNRFRQGIGNLKGFWKIIFGDPIKKTTFHR